MSINRGRVPDPNDPYEDDTQALRRGRLEPEHVEYVEERYVEPPVVPERYVEPIAPPPLARERYVERAPVVPVVSDRRYTLARYARFIYFVFGLIEALIALRAVFRLLGANPRAGFANFLYQLTAPFVAPFRGIFSEPSFGSRRFGDPTLELSALVAIIVYALLAYMLVRLLYLFAD